MPQTFNKVGASPDDFELDTPGHGGTAPNTYTRLRSDGTTGGNPAKGNALWPKVSAEAIPHRDEAFVVGGGQPFGRVLAASRNTETLVRDLRLNARDMLNFEAAGGIAGSGITAANAAKNTEIWDYLLSVVSAGAANGIFFPGRRYEFMEWAGVALYTANTAPTDLYALHTLPVRGLNGLTICGAGEGATTLAANSNANQAHDFMFFADCSNLTICDLRVEKHSTQTNGAVIQVETEAASINTIKIKDVTVQRGIPYGIRVEANSTFNANYVWVDDCSLLDTIGVGVWFESISNGWIQKNVLTGTVQSGIRVNTVGLPKSLNSIYILDNILGGTAAAQEIKVSRSGTYDGTIHKNFVVARNQIGIGDIVIEGVNEWAVDDNTLFDGGIQVSFPGQAGAHNLKLRDNYINNGIGSNAGILFDCNGVTVNGLLISGGRIFGVDTYGIDIKSQNGSVRLAHIHDLTILDCARKNDANYSGIRFHEVDATGGVSRSNIHDVTCWITAATAGGFKMTYGVEMTNNGGSTTHNKVHDLITVGYVTLDVLLRGVSTEHNNDDLGMAPIA